MLVAGIERTLAPLSEAALALQMNRERVLRRVQNGELPGMRIGGRWFIPRSALPARDTTPAAQSRGAA